MITDAAANANHPFVAKSTTTNTIEAKAASA